MRLLVHCSCLMPPSQITLNNIDKISFLLVLLSCRNHECRNEEAKTAAAHKNQQITKHFYLSPFLLFSCYIYYTIFLFSCK